MKLLATVAGALAFALAAPTAALSDSIAHRDSAAKQTAQIVTRIAFHRHRVWLWQDRMHRHRSQYLHRDVDATPQKLARLEHFWEHLHYIVRWINYPRYEAQLAAAARARQAQAAPTASYGVWDELAACESSGNWADTKGMFEGGLQFLNSTWLANGGGQYAQHAYDATREQQIAIAIRTQAAGGWSQWPACSARLGLG